MTTRAQRETILETRTGARLKGLRKDPCKTSFLDAMDTADREGLNQTVEALIAQIDHSGHGAGFLLELEVAIALFEVPAPRVLRCEQKEGLCVVPGDLWLDWRGRRFEFQCKHIMNWSVELLVAGAIDTIERATLEVEPGRLFELAPGLDGTEQDWKDFAQWVVRNNANWKDDETISFDIDGRHVATITMTPVPGVGVRYGRGWSPGGVQKIKPDFLREKKLTPALQAARRSLSALPSEEQINCLTVQFADELVDEQDVFHALYGQEFLRMGPNIEPTPGFNWNGLWYSDKRWDVLSAVVLPKVNRCNPLSVSATVFPHPSQAALVADALEGLPGFQVIQKPSDVPD